MSSIFFTSESVSEGHPDKICDQISDAILDAILAQDPDARVACETAVKTGIVFVFGEIRTNAWVDIEGIVRDTVKEIGYTDAAYGFDYATCGVINAIGQQSADIAQGVDAGEHKELGAGDQGMMFGYATNQTPDFMPLPISLAHQLARRIADIRKANTIPYLRPDAKTQVTVEYDRDTMKPLRVDTVVLSTQHDEGIDQTQLAQDVHTHVITPTLGDLLDDHTTIYINPTGNFVVGGPLGDAGLTGRKIIVDTYGGYAPHGGGAFSGKDPSKVDRSGAYMARYIAKNIVAAGFATDCQVELAYAIGVSQPVSIWVNTFGTATVDEHLLEHIVPEVFDCTPAGIISMLQLREPRYRSTAAYGHFGQNALHQPWEQLDQVDALRAAVNQTTPLT